LGLKTHLLAVWEANEPPSSEESLTGKVSQFSDEQIAFVTSTYQSYEKERKRVKIDAFMKHLRKLWKNKSWLTPPPSRKTVENMLVGNGCRQVEARSTKRPSYHPAIKRFSPHVQAVLDGKKVIVSLGSQDFGFAMEYSKDMAADAIGGFDVDKTETAELVKGAFENHSLNHRRPLAALVDHGSGNKKAAVDLAAEGVLVIKAHPYRAETKGQIEGEFGLFERKVSRIVIDGQTQEQQAMSILKKIAEIYLRLRNQTPRCSTCPFTPAKLMKANLDSIAAEEAYKELKAQDELKKKHQEQRLKITAEMRHLVENIVKEHHLSGNMLQFKRSMRWIEISTIKKAAMQFAAQSKRDTFDAGKKNMAYFYAIAKNMQLEIDQNHMQQEWRRLYSLEREFKEERNKIQLALEEKQRQRMLQKSPHLRVLQAIKGEMSLPPDFRKTIKFYKKMLDEALLSILRKSNIIKKKFVEKIHEGVMALSEFTLELRYQLINQINNRLNELSPNSAKVVTPN
jgi:hypothetical protein